MGRRHKAVVLGLLVVAVTGWILVNPGGGFGLSRFGLTTYNRLPIPVIDFEVRADGAVRWITKTHDIQAQGLTWLLTPLPPEVVILALGWRNAAHGPTDLALSGTKIIVLPTDEALALYNVLKQRGVRVAIHVHSTC